jgi:glutamate synthase (NADPH/NADH) large chain
MTQKWTPSLFKDFHKQEHDACGIVACLEKTKSPTRKNIFDCIDALVTMNHRAGFINGEGDGVGIHTDIPVELWKEKLLQAGQEPSLAEIEEFAVGHVFISQKVNWETTKQELIKKLEKYDFDLIYETDKVTDTSALGPIAIQENPVFWQFACLSTKKGQELSKSLFDALVDLETNEHVHVASLSQNHVVYKVMGAGDILPRYYYDLANPLSD